MAVEVCGQTRLSPAQCKPLSLCLAYIQWATMFRCPEIFSLEERASFGLMKRTVLGMNPVCWTAPIWALVLATVTTVRMQAFFVMVSLPENDALSNNFVSKPLIFLIIFVHFLLILLSHPSLSPPSSLLQLCLFFIPVH